MITEVSDVTLMPFPLFSITEFPEILTEPAVVMPLVLLDISELLIFTTASLFVPETTLFAFVIFTLFKFNFVSLSSTNRARLLAFRVERPVSLETPLIFNVPFDVAPKSELTSYTSSEVSKLKFLSSFVSS